MAGELDRRLSYDGGCGDSDCKLCRADHQAAMERHLKANKPKCERCAELLAELDKWHMAFAHAILTSPEEAFQYLIDGKSIEARAREWFEAACTERSKP